MRSLGKATILALATLTASAALNCSGESQRNIPSDGVKNAGSVGLELQIAPGINIDSVNYQITGPNGYSSSGVINVSNSTTISALIGGIPAGVGYTITLTAVSTEDTGVNCVGSATFNVTANSTTPVTVGLQCRRPAKGSIIINGTVNICPSIDAIGAAPTSVALNGTVSLSSAGSDLDNVPNPITYRWHEGATTIATTANAAYTCAVLGSHTITLTVTDGDPGCEDVGTVTVNCTTGTTGGTGGAGGAGGATGGAGGATGGAGGTTGGAGGATGGAGGATGGAGGTTGDDGGTTGGAGGATGGSAGAGGATGGSGGTTGGAGGATGGAGGATGGAGGATGGAGGTGGGGATTQSLLEAASTTCFSCLRDSGPALDPSCDLTVLNCEKFTDATQRQNCLDTLACALPAGAATSCVGAMASNLTPCFCGTVPTSDCLSGSPASGGAVYGQCKPLIEAGFPGQSTGFIAANLSNADFSAGVALKLARCAADIAYAFAIDETCGTCF
jgi:hypothetical protein